METDKVEGSQEPKKKCCSGHGCGCGGKLFAALVLLLLGWIVGFLSGSGGLCRKNKSDCHQSMMKACPMSDMPAEGKSSK